MERRAFFKSSGLALFGAGAVPGWLARAAQGPKARRRVLVTIFQRGAMDGLSAVVPYGDPAYRVLRPTLALDRTLDLDGFLGLHPALAPLKPLWDAKQLAIVEAAGSPDPTRSHFDAQDYMESGTPGLKATRDGWLNRTLERTAQPSPVRAVAVGSDLPRMLRGPQPAVALSSVSDFRLRDAMAAPELEASFAKSSMANLSRETFEAMRILKALPASNTTVAYPATRLGRSLQEIARLIKADVGLELAFADMGGWDTHINQAQRLTQLLGEFGGALAAFWQDLGDRLEDVAVVTMSEFGRTARENGTRGTDHGHANLMFAFGGGIQGGRVHGTWPGLAKEQLYEGRDLAVTTDFRTVLSQLVTGHLGQSAPVFPGFAPQPFSLLRA
ncbi:MAG: DUF1501 domain-containing protein [Bryobacteraceae bacterium]|nr:DUF1501 domain-containing protein [Bryobacteraceae bacterium]